MKKYKVIALIGKAGSGKDSILGRLVDNQIGLHEIISYTTRPPRDNEVNGHNYHFISNEEFTRKLLKGEMVEAAVFNDWCYGTAYDNLRMDLVNVGVFNPIGIESLLSHKGIDLQVYYVRCSDKTRFIRQLARETNPDIDEIIRRYKTDKIDFADLDFDYIELENETIQDLDNCVRTILDKVL